MDTDRIQSNLNDDEPETAPLLDDGRPEMGSVEDGTTPVAELDGDDDGETDADYGDEYERELDEDGRQLDEDDDQQRALGGSRGESPPADLEGLVHYVVSKLVSDPASIEISSEQRGGTMYIALRVPEGDLGRVIGREGRTAKAIRTLVSIAGSKSNVHARLDIDG